MHAIHLHILHTGVTPQFLEALARTLAAVQQEGLPLCYSAPTALEDPHVCLSRQQAATPRRNLLLLCLTGMPDERCYDFIRSASAARPPYPVLVIAEACSPAGLTRLLQSGAADFATLPFSPADLYLRIERLIHRPQPPLSVPSNHPASGLQQLVGNNLGFRAVVDAIPTLAQSDANVFFAGETGTGKELCARALHYLSPRHGRRFSPVNCGALPVELVENELFGHARGAYTGAMLRHAGLIAETNGGTIFFDEIDCLPASAQVKLLRFLQDREFRPLGSTRVETADVRVVAAMNGDVERALCDGRLRRDLFYRLNIVSLRLPPLRERRDDIPLLAEHFLRKHGREAEGGPRALTRTALDALFAHSWPGNVRELEHVIQRALLMSRRSTLEAEDLLPRLSPLLEVQRTLKEAKAQVVEAFEKSYIIHLLQSHQGNITRAARTAGKNRRAFWQLLHKYAIDAGQYRPEPVLSSVSEAEELSASYPPLR